MVLDRGSDSSLEVLKEEKDKEDECGLRVMDIRMTEGQVNTDIIIKDEK